MPCLLRLVILAVAVLFAGGFAMATDYHVDPDLGSDRADGTSATAGPEDRGPVRTLARGVKLLRPGDTLHLAPRARPYRESLTLSGLSGTPDHPITIDGHGAVLTGAEPLDPREWREVGPGLATSDTVYTQRKMGDFDIQRIFFIIDGIPQRMGRTSKGSKAPWKKADDLQPGEWTFDPGSKAFTLRLKPGQSIDASGVEFTARLNGVAISGTPNAHLVIRNLTVTRFRNDGFNLHEHTRNVRFENIAAYECGDDGFSAHENCQSAVVGFRASRNSTGFSNAFSSDTTLDRGVVADNYAYELMQGEDSTFAITNTVVIANVSRPVRILGDAKLPNSCRGTFDNVLIACSSTGNQARCDVSANAILTARRLTCLGASWNVDGEVHLSDSILGTGNGPGVLTVRGIWAGERNVYDLRHYLSGTSDLGPDLPAFLTATTQDNGSRAAPISVEIERAILAGKSPFAPVGSTLALP